MAYFTPNGKISGKLGDVVFRNYNGKTIICSRPGPQKKSTDPNVIARRNRFKLAVKLSGELGRIPVMKCIWYQFGIRSPITWLTTLVIISILAALAKAAYVTKRHWSKSPKNRGNQPSNNSAAPDKKVAVKWLISLYGAVWFIGLGCFFSIEPKQDRDWMAEVSERVTYRRDANNPDLVTLTNVRNFDWHTDKEAAEH